jgi:hypothetical protein
MVENGEKQGTGPRLFLGQVSVSPQGFPRQKFVVRGGNPGCSRCSQDNYFLAYRGCAWETHVRPRKAPGCFPAGPPEREADCRQLRLISQPRFLPHDRIKIGRACGPLARDRRGAVGFCWFAALEPLAPLQLDSRARAAGLARHSLTAAISAFGVNGLRRQTVAPSSRVIFRKSGEGVSKLAKA